MSEPQIDIPITVDQSEAAEIANRLENGKSVKIVLTQDTAPRLSERIMWQLDTGRRIVSLVDDPATETSVATHD